MSINLQRPSEPEAINLPPDGLSLHQAALEVDSTLGALPVGARLVVRCKADWRAATVSTVTPECVRLNVNSPRGGTYRLRRPPDTAIYFDGCVPVLTDCDETTWRDGWASYDKRW